jgi:hypothetical protein
MAPLQLHGIAIALGGPPFVAILVGQNRPAAPWGRAVRWGRAMTRAVR